MSLRFRLRPWSGLCGLLWLALGGVATAEAAPRVRIGVENQQPPMSFLDAQNRPSGFTADLLREVAQAGSIEFEIVPGPWRLIYDEFQAGRLDVLANVTIFEERRAFMDFSISHAFSHGVVYFRPGQPAIRRTADFAGKRLATLRGSTGNSYALAHGGWGGTVIPCESWQAALDATHRGDCDAALFIIPSSTDVGNTHDLRRGFVEDIIHHFHFAVHKGDSRTLERLNEALATVRHNGAFDRIYSQWIEPLEPHPVRLADLRRYFLPAGLLVLGVVLVIWWQRQVLARLSRQARALQQSEERWKFAVEGSRDGMWDWNIRTAEVLRSPRWKEMLGFADHEISQRPAEWSERVHPDDRASAMAVMQAHLDRVTPAYAHEHRLRCKDGQWKWTLDRGLVVSRDAEGKPLRMIGTATDISERKTAEAALRESERKYRLLFENLTVGFALHEMIYDEKGRPIDYRYLEVNPAFGKLTGVPPSALIGRTVKEVMPNTEAHWIETFGRVATTGEPTAYSNYAVELKRHYDTWVFCPSPGFFAVIFSDITARKAAEAAIHQLNADLEQRVAGRTAELATRVAEVERLNAELEAFSYSVSHDLRTPLRNITGFIELLAGRSAGRLDPESTRYVETVTREATRLGTLIDELLEFSRVGRTELKLGRVPLDELVAEVRAELQPATAGRAIEWRIGALPALEADRALLRQVVANLLGNAVKFTRHRAPAGIEIGTLANAPAADGRVTIFVRDNGAGFNPKYADKLFGVFQRLHNQRDFEGTGIGLANVKRIIERHGGRVWAEGSVDKGATFYFNLKPHPV